MIGKGRHFAENMYLIVACTSGDAIFEGEDGNSQEISVWIRVIRIAFYVERVVADCQTCTGQSWTVGRGEGRAIARRNEGFGVGILSV